ncbi:hypothetical protein DCS_08089 [Drechmeria coniospora]|uniref:Uncharacterized protein n=1 Tax=Drechmeria coniospora TaxID=98403 RepID=A0A151GG94_DRECN|nr:hypothetical protein DCS_08089 [Drechmeria coniospora]KYK56123.1 hypothetical protein DCS_08089 [Drechmeria coniospora]
MKQKNEDGGFGAKRKRLLYAMLRTAASTMHFCLFDAFPLLVVELWKASLRWTVPKLALPGLSIDQGLSRRILAVRGRLPRHPSTSSPPSPSPSAWQGKNAFFSSVWREGGSL